MKNINWMFVLICCFLARIIAMQASFAESIVFIACISYLLLDKYLEINKVEKYNEDILDKINKLEEEVITTRDSVAAVRIGNTFGQNQKK